MLAISMLCLAPNYTTFFDTIACLSITALVALYSTVLVKFNQGATTYVKNVYSVVFVTGLGLLFLFTNVNFALPIYYVLELGTVLFMLVLLKSNTGFFTEVEESSVQIQPIYIFVSILSFFEIIKKTTNVWCRPETTIDVFVDYFKKNKYLNEFYPFIIGLVTYKNILFLGFLIFIIVATGAIIYIKQTSLIPSRGLVW